MVNQIFDSKLQWRKYLKIVRQEISPLRRKEGSANACEKIKSLLPPHGLILSFASFGSEIDLNPLNVELAANGQLVLPRVTDKHLHLYQVENLDHLESHAWGMLEPRPSLCKLIDLSLIKVALIPGLGFDTKTHYRLGFGGGYYDRLLANAPSSLQTWGIGFIEQSVENLPYDLTDIPLDHIYLA